jgi:hypothetical protein
MMQQTTSERIGISVEPERLELLPGGSASLHLILVNRGSIVDEFSLVVEEVDPAWITIPLTAATLFPGSDERLAFDIHLPDDNAIAAGHHIVRLKVRSRAAPDEVSVLDVPLEILPVGGLQLHLRPWRATTSRGATYQIELISTSNAVQELDLVFADPDEMLQGRLSADALTVAVGATVEVSLRVQPKRRSRLGPSRAYTFTTTALPAVAPGEAVEQLGVVDGELVYRPPLAFLSRVPGRIWKLALAFGALALAAGIAVWFLAQPGHRGPLVERAPALK